MICLSFHINHAILCLAFLVFAIFPIYLAASLFIVSSTCLDLLIWFTCLICDTLPICLDITYLAYFLWFVFRICLAYPISLFCMDFLPRAICAAYLNSVSQFASELHSLLTPLGSSISVHRHTHLSRPFSCLRRRVDCLRTQARLHRSETRHNLHRLPIASRCFCHRRQLQNRF